MPSKDVVDRFIATVTGGDYVGAIERFYTPEASMQENQDAPRVGRNGLVRHEQGIMSMFEHMDCELLGPPLIAGDRVAIQWKFAFTPPGGEPRTLQEVAWQRWEGERIAEESFFYDPRQIAGPA